MKTTVYPNELESIQHYEFFTKIPQPEFTEEIRVYCDYCGDEIDSEDYDSLERGICNFCMKSLSEIQS